MPNLFKFNHAAIRIRDQLILKDITWQVKENQHWAILGPNGSGKSTLIKTLINDSQVAVVEGQLTKSSKLKAKSSTAHLSFDTQQKILTQEDKLTQARYFAGTLDTDHTTTRDLILSGINKHDSPPWQEPVLSLSKEGARGGKQIEKLLNLLTTDYRLLTTDILEQNITTLSTGQLRKAFIARALMKHPQLLILDEPYDGLDQLSRTEFTNTLTKISDPNIRNSKFEIPNSVLVTHRIDQIHAGITHVLLLKNGRILAKGKKEHILTSQNISQLYDTDLKIIPPLNEGRLGGVTFKIKKTTKDSKLNLTGISYPTTNTYTINYNIHPHRPNLLHLYDHFPSTIPDPIIKFTNVTIAYNQHKSIVSGQLSDVIALSDLNWTFRPDQHWAILGPNGSGKSTIVKLTIADHPQAHSNQIKVFGRQLGQGTSIWDLKQPIGLLSSELHAHYRRHLTGFDVISSGYFDSVGLYKRPTPEQLHQTGEWIKVLQLVDLAHQKFSRLSTGQQRLILLARAVIKPPVLLILDEPTHGLDIPNRKRILDLIQTIGETPTRLLYITHHQDELLPCLTHLLQLDKGKVTHQGPLLRHSGRDPESQLLQ